MVVEKFNVKKHLLFIAKLIINCYPKIMVKHMLINTIFFIFLNVDLLCLFYMLNKKKIAKIILQIIIILFAIIGFGLTGAYMAVKFHITDDPGGVDYNDRYFQEINNLKETKTKQSSDSLYNKIKSKTYLYYKIMVLNEFFPRSAKLILDVYDTTKDAKIAERMFDVINLHMKDNWDFQQKINQGKSLFRTQINKPSTIQIYQWMNMTEWEDFKIAVVKDKALIDSAASLTGVEPRLIVSVLVGEQIRLFNSNREIYKNVIGPLKILSVESVFSFGVTGIKKETAAMIEYYLKDSISIYYMGENYKTLLDFKTEDPETERHFRLVDYRNHFYSYLYAAVFLKQVELQWKRSGFDISHRPEILATLYNIGFWMSKPKANPKVGGSKIEVNGAEYTFGALSYEFYYSGELFNEFPIPAIEQNKLLQ